MFDSCLLLGSNGNVVYSGPQRLAQSYMAFLGFYIPPNENLADFLLDVTAGEQHRTAASTPGTAAALHCPGMDGFTAASVII
jgi:hypothetical protein